MDWMRILLSRGAASFGKKRLDKDLDEELRAHIDLAIHENLQRGMPLVEAYTQDIRCGLHC